MIRAMADFFRELGDNLGNNPGNHPGNNKAAPETLGDEDIHLLSAALMAEVIASDGSHSGGEREKLEAILAEDFHLAPEQIGEIVGEATGRASRATSLFEFTDLVNRHFSHARKRQLIEHLWHIAHADGQVHKLEEATIRKIADLIHLSHTDFIRARHGARPG